MAQVLGGTPGPILPRPPKPLPPINKIPGVKSPGNSGPSQPYKDLPHPIGAKLLPPVNNLHTPGHPVDRGGSRGYAGISGHRPYNPITDNHILHAAPPHMGGMTPMQGK